VLKYTIESAVKRVHAGTDVELGCWVLFKSDKEEINKDSTGYKEVMLQSSKKVYGYIVIILLCLVNSL